MKSLSHLFLFCVVWGNQSQMRNSTTPVTVSSESRTQRAAARTRRRSNPVSAASELTGAWTGKQRGNIIESKCVPVAATWLNDNNATRCVTIWFSVKIYRPRLDSGSDAFSCRALNVAFPTNIHQSVAWNVFCCFYWVVSWLQKFQKGAKLCISSNSCQVLITQSYSVDEYFQNVRKKKNAIAKMITGVADMQTRTSIVPTSKRQHSWSS